MRRVEAVAVAVAALGWLGSCGGSGTPTTVATPTPAPVRSVVGQGSFTIGAPDEDFTYYEYAVINTTSTGTLETTVNWTYPSNTVWMYMAEGDCTEDKFDNDDCPGGPTCACRFSVLSEVNTPKPRVLTVRNASPGMRTLIVWNLGPQEESCTYESALTTTVGGLTPAAAHSAAVETARKRMPRRLFPGR